MGWGMPVSSEMSRASALGEEADAEEKSRSGRGPDGVHIRGL